MSTTPTPAADVEIGWQVVDANGVVVQSGPVTFAYLVADGDDDTSES